MAAPVLQGAARRPDGGTGPAGPPAPRASAARPAATAPSHAALPPRPAVPPSRSPSVSIPSDFQTELHRQVAAAAAQEKAFLAEKNVAVVRAFVIAFNLVVWYLLWDRQHGVPWLAAAVSVVAAVYAAFVLVFKPYRRLPVLRTSLFTAVTDAALITLWLVATGASRSPFEALWFVSLVAIAFRYRLRGALVATALYVACYRGVLASDGSLSRAPADALVRIVYVVFAGALAGLLGRETFRQIGTQATLRSQTESAHATQMELGLLRRLTTGLGGDDNLDATLGRVVAEAAQAAGWSIGEAWVPDRDGRLRRCAVWSAPDDGLQAFAHAGAGLRFVRGEGLAGQAWAERRIVWSTQPANLVRADAATAAGLGAAVALPVFAEGLVIAVLQFFLPRLGPDDGRLAQLVATATAHVGPALLRRQAEARFRTLAEAALEGICLHDRGVILEANGAFARLVGYAPEELVGLHLRRLVAPEHHSTLRERLERVATQPFEIRLLRKDGTRFLAEVQARALPFQDRTVRVSAVRDITERRKAEEADRLALGRQMEITRLQEVNRIKTHLLNTASHELNTPLTPLKLQLHLLASDRLGSLSAPQRRAVGVLQRNVDRLSDLVHDVLDVARLQGAGLRLEPREVAVAEVIAEVRDSFAEAAREKGLHLVAHAPEDARLHGDRDRLVQVLFNLLSNALKFTDRGRVSLRAEAGDGGVAFYVEDTGRGLTREQMERLFQPFSQVHDPATTSVRGTGLGLYICKGIVEQHGGTMWVESAGPGAGSRFAFRLPCAGPPASRPQGPDDGPRSVRPPRPPRGAGPAAGSIPPQPHQDPEALGAALGAGADP